MRDDLICSLDIGTRTIIGLVGKYTEDEKFKVIAYAIKEHKKRNMYDGQIHDIEGVATTVKEIVNELEEKIEGKLKVVSIAAAGRALKTHRIKIENKIEGLTEISRRQIEALELEAVQKAEDEVNKYENKKLKYYNIGYTVVSYFLEEDKMESLVGHRGESIGVELLATFLPQVVIESLYSVISKVGLEVGSITLEPIAAINVAIKKELRLLNLALVDIGAGTSDIAITKGGEITSYGMTQIAGDEITERLAKAYLLDFNASEKLKIELSQKEEHEFTDVVGISHKLTTSEIVNNITDVIEEISQEIGDKILEYNGKAPNAVFLIGGSSQMPMLKEKIAEKLGLPKERVSIRDTSFIQDIEGLDTLTGPDMITPIGIAMEGVEDKYKNFLKVIFKGEEVRIFNTENIKVSDILILTGYNPRNLMPKPANKFIYYINGKKRVVLGKAGTQPEILINGKQGSLKTELKDGDIIDITESKVEPIEEPRLYDIVEVEKNINFNERNLNLVKSIKINGNIIKDNIELKSEDKIYIDEIKTLDELIYNYKIESPNTKFYINDIKAEVDERVKKGDYVKSISKDKANKEQWSSEEENNLIRLTINDEEKEIYHKKDKFVFVDIFDYIDFDLSKLQGTLYLKINGRDAEYMEKLNDGDNIEVKWQ